MIQVMSRLDLFIQYQVLLSSLNTCWDVPCTNWYDLLPILLLLIDQY
jgi:hypothetical protein